MTLPDFHRFNVLGGSAIYLSSSIASAQLLSTKDALQVSTIRTSGGNGANGQGSGNGGISNLGGTSGNRDGAGQSNGSGNGGVNNNSGGNRDGSGDGQNRSYDNYGGYQYDNRYSLMHMQAGCFCACLPLQVARHVQGSSRFGYCEVACLAPAQHRQACH